MSVTILLVRYGASLLSCTSIVLSAEEPALAKVGEPSAEVKRAFKLSPFYKKHIMGEWIASRQFGEGVRRLRLAKPSS